MYRSRQQHQIGASSLSDLGLIYCASGTAAHMERHFIEKAWLQSGKRKKQAAALLGYNHDQTLDQRLKKLGIE